MSKAKRGFEKISRQQWIADYFGDKASENYNNIMLPKRATKASAGYDFYSPIDIMLDPGKDIKIVTGIKAFMQKDEYLMIIPRSSMGFKYYMRLANTVAIGDSDYYDNSENEGHYWIKIRNESNVIFEIKKGQAFAQGIFQKYLTVDETEDLPERVGGIGSTG